MRMQHNTLLSVNISLVLSCTVFSLSGCMLVTALYVTLSFRYFYSLIVLLNLPNKLLLRKQWNCLEKEIRQRTMPGARRRGRPRTALIDDIEMWTGLSVEESVRMTEDRDKWRKYVHGVVNPRIEDG